MTDRSAASGDIPGSSGTRASRSARLPEPVGGLDAGAVRALELPASASPARVYDYWLGGKDHFPVDREVGDSVARLLPGIVPTVRANRRFLARAVTYLAGGLGVDQFVDLGSGLPTALNVHEVAQRARPDARVVYVDHDPVVLAHARALLARDERTVVVGGDARDAERIVTDPGLCATVDWSRPVAVLMVAVLHFLTEQDDPAATVAAFAEAMAPGSFLVLSHATPGPAGQGEALREAVEIYRHLAAPLTVRTQAEITRLFAGFDLLCPGLVPVDRWQVPGQPSRSRSRGGGLHGLAGVGQLPGGTGTGAATGTEAG